MTVFSLVAALTAAANIVGMTERDGPNHALYFVYTAEESLELAALLGLAFLVLPVVGFYAVQQHSGLRALAKVAPGISSDFRGRRFVLLSVAFAFLVTMANARYPHGIAGTSTFLVRWWPNIVAFTLARMAAERRRVNLFWLALAVALAESARAFFFGYLRGDIATPIFALITGSLLGARSLRAFPMSVMIPALLVGILWAANYGVLGEVRGRASGIQKIAYIREYQAARFATPDAPPQHNVLTRLTSFNQLSQIGRIANRDGFLRGATFSYLNIVLIPRFLWPEKPRIALGTWYALRIGEAVETEDGWATTSINMTQAGEMYLNWGWVGVLLGLPIFGAIYGVIWSRANFWEQGSRNVLGGALGFVMMWMMLGAHGEFTAVFTLLAVYLLLLAASYTFQLAPAVNGYLSRYLHVPRMLQLLRPAEWRAMPIHARTK